MKLLTTLTVILVSVASISAAEIRQSFSVDFEVDGQNAVEGGSSGSVYDLIFEEEGEELGCGCSDDEEESEGLSVDIDAGAVYRIENLFSNGTVVGLNIGFDKAWDETDGFSDNFSKVLTLSQDWKGAYFELDHNLTTKTTTFNISKSANWNW